MIEAVFYIGGFLGVVWMGLVLFVAARSFILSAQQMRAERIYLSREHID
jgi:hypothetical protein